MISGGGGGAPASVGLTVSPALSRIHEVQGLVCGLSTQRSFLCLDSLSVLQVHEHRTEWSPQSPAQGGAHGRNSVSDGVRDDPRDAAGQLRGPGREENHT